MTWFKSIVVMAAVVGVIAFVCPPFSFADEWDDLPQKIRDAKTPADHQALAAFYEKEAQAAHKLHNIHVNMEPAYAASRIMQEKGRPVEHCRVVAEKYRDVAKEYEALAAMHKAMAEQLK
jgi:hypothetical protein